ncbi:hypothetical protein [Candidatus Phycosocius spiralis]|uniref:Uncharacterized protein n=1 Tax=Candidatus Phycosocius spiralis TaxID=2815099 RepID=A0ABQ4PSJ8_9PROT|nr:hypothetical protein [Candidatus Phycosocius spiralis]GIU65983.1 hypothetical protein PsB1_0137 [Candidatus Phycosocius spiralis]
MMDFLPQSAKNFYQRIFALVSGLLIASALLFGVVALAICGFLIGCAGAISARMRKPDVSALAYVTRHTYPSGRGWRIDPSFGR